MSLRKLSRHYTRPFLRGDRLRRPRAGRAATKTPAEAARRQTADRPFARTVTAILRVSHAAGACTYLYGVYDVHAHTARVGYLHGTTAHRVYGLAHTICPPASSPCYRGPPLCTHAVLITPIRVQIHTNTLGYYYYCAYVS